MSIYRLGSDAWEVILGYLEASDTIQLLLCGDTTLWSCLKPAFRDFVVCLRSVKAQRLSSLLSIFNDLCSKPRRFSITLEDGYKGLQIISEEYTAEKWKSFWPENLDTLELAIPCDKPPFSSVLASLGTLAPRLKNLYAQKVPQTISLPQSLTFLEIGYSELKYPRNAALGPLFDDNVLPSTLTHLKFSTNMFLTTTIDATKLGLRKMPLKYFHGNITFYSMTEEQACWSILPDTITHLHARLHYGARNQKFGFPKNLTWKQMFPNLKHLEIPLESLGDASTISSVPVTSEGQISEKQIETIRSLFPATLTALSTISDPSTQLSHGVPLIIRALGDRLTSYKDCYTRFGPAVLKWLPKWENPKVSLMKTEYNRMIMRTMISESENFENFLQKDHPISLLYRSATSLNTGFLLASAISLLPRTLTSLELISTDQEPFSLASASNALKRMKLNGKTDDSVNTDYENGFAWPLFDWPPNLTHLKLSPCAPQPLHLGCLPDTLSKLYIKSHDMFELEGGDLSHLTKLEDFCFVVTSETVINSLNGLPRSLTWINTLTMPIAAAVFENPDFQNFFSNLQILNLSVREYSANVLLTLPRTLKTLILLISRDGPCLSESHFENISFAIKLTFLSLSGDISWPEELDMDLFSRFMPFSLATLSLNLFRLQDKKEKIEKLANHIPNTLLEFTSGNDLLHRLVQTRITEYRSSITASRRVKG